MAQLMRWRRNGPNEVAVVKLCAKGSVHSYIKLTRRIVKDFGALPKENIVKPRVGLVGEILRSNIILMLTIMPSS